MRLRLVENLPPKLEIQWLAFAPVEPPLGSPKLDFFFPDFFYGFLPLLDQPTGCKHAEFWKSTHPENEHEIPFPCSWVDSTCFFLDSSFPVDMFRFHTPFSVLQLSSWVFSQWVFGDTCRLNSRQRGNPLFFCENSRAEAKLAVKLMRNLFQLGGNLFPIALWPKLCNKAW